MMIWIYKIILLFGSTNCLRHPNYRQFNALQKKVTTLERNVEDLKFEIKGLKNDHELELIKIRREIADLKSASNELDDGLYGYDSIIDSSVSQSDSESSKENRDSESYYNWF